MSPELTLLIGQLGIAAIFVIAWFRESASKEKMRIEKDAEIIKLYLEISQLHTDQRKETLELIRDIIAGKPIDTTPSTQ